MNNPVIMYEEETDEYFVVTKNNLEEFQKLSTGFKDKSQALSFINKLYEVYEYE